VSSIKLTGILNEDGILTHISMAICGTYKHDLRAET
jgi:hypothetical protein